MNNKNRRLQNRAYPAKAGRQLQIVARTDTGAEVMLGWMAPVTDQPWLDLLNHVTKKYATDEDCALTWDELRRQTS
jgi:hypothetical protein